uniref:Type II restriction endonuclease EcoO109I n=1 Tax=Candidatus Kentrum sp. LPFa TaxID=2126335 RepID=A0A450WDZ3_9GAMM|nr:MAG: Type II restriction endonuclease EcoO109I [Candidatus Kentron sp. LPFa]
MHSASSVLDGRRREGGVVRLATLKSGPRCLNDEMSKDLADDIVGHAEQWAKEAGVDHVDFTYGVLYGTKKRSNKKDWHILRNIVETRGARFVIKNPKHRWDCSFRIRGIRIDVAVRIGGDWWAHLGDTHTLAEIMCALIRSCVTPARTVEESAMYTISDLGDIVSTECVPGDYNVSLLQRSQIQWLFFLARHYCDRLEE